MNQPPIVPAGASSVEDFAVVMAVVTVGGLGIQQLLQMVDPLVARYIAWQKQRAMAGALLSAIAESDYKKAIMTRLAFAFALILVKWTGIRTLTHVIKEINDWGDFLITALVLSAGTEGANTLLKFFGYAKDARKPGPDVTVTIFPSTVSIAPSSSLQFEAVVANGSPVVSWTVVEGLPGGSITNGGMYTAPAVAGTFHVACVSSADMTKPTYATVTVA